MLAAAAPVPAGALAEGAAEEAPAPAVVERTMVELGKLGAELTGMATDELPGTTTGAETDGATTGALLTTGGLLSTGAAEVTTTGALEYTGEEGTAVGAWIWPSEIWVMGRTAEEYSGRAKAPAAKARTTEARILDSCVGECVGCGEGVCSRLLAGIDIRSEWLARTLERRTCWR
jgi:hypothetical protein